ncbi:MULTISPECIES: DNA cytosine methyltransferase [unclassified Mesorhizobium]|uniref:DNA cytosine methyltransferase n=1 Tax=unclassified Mesorhizobium TaxID=325217 RepID=UPI001AEC0841
MSGFLAPRFETYREQLRNQLGLLGYAVDWRLFNAADFGVPQARQRVFIVAMLRRYSSAFAWPEPAAKPPIWLGRCQGLAVERYRPGSHHRRWLKEARWTGPWPYAHSAGVGKARRERQVRCRCRTRAWLCRLPSPDRRHGCPPARLS